MEEISIKAEEIFHLGALPVTNTLIVSLISFSVLAILGILFRRSLSAIPGKLQNFIELSIEGLLNLVDSVLHDRHKTESYFPLIATVFLFILISNWLGLLPGVGSFTFEEGKHTVPLFRSPASDLNFTIALAIISVIMTNVLGILAIGFFKHFSKFINFRGPIDFFVGILEFISELAKIISFAFRLFGNVFAGEVLLTIMIFLLPYVVPVPFLMLEVFVGFIQAFVFTMLTIVFISIATAEHHS